MTSRMTIHGNPYDLAVRHDVEAVERRVNVVIAGGLAFALAIMAVQVQILLVVSDIASKVG